MKISIIGSTKPGYKLPKEEAIDFSGKSAGICYMPEDLNTLFSEASEKTTKRAESTLKSGHHSVYDHPVYNLALENIPKILAIILNNEKMYTTSEKSARYTKMTPSPEESTLYEKWITIYKEVISNLYPTLKEKQVEKLAQENARYLISIFTPSTIMEHTLSLRQINYIYNWFTDYIENAEDNEFNKLLKPCMKEFIDSFPPIILNNLSSKDKNRKLSLFATRSRKEEFGENYSTNYYATFAEFAQAQRHRTLDYEISLDEHPKFYVPLCIRGTKYEKEWLTDISSLSSRFPQGMLVKINERGTVENFVLKCKERLCGCAQLEIMLQTKETLDKYIDSVKTDNPEIYSYLLNYESGVRCSFKDFNCTAPCIWGSKNSLNRLI